MLETLSKLNGRGGGLNKKGLSQLPMPTCKYCLVAHLYNLNSTPMLSKFLIIWYMHICMIYREARKEDWPQDSINEMREREVTYFLCNLSLFHVNSERVSREREISVEWYTQPCYTQHMEFWTGERSFPHGKNKLYALS